MEIVEKAFKVMCNLCGAPRWKLPSGVFVCDNCDYAHGTAGRSTIPNKDM